MDWKKLVIIIFALSMYCYDAFAMGDTPQISNSGVKATQTRLQTGSDGLTIEQRNIKERLSEDNKVGAIKHLYVISAYSGQVIIYSTVKGKITSSGKRLSPYTLAGGCERGNTCLTTPVGRTTEILQDDGTYGSSLDYIYWWDTKGIYHQHFIAGGQIVHISNQPLAVKSIIINMEVK